MRRLVMWNLQTLDGCFEGAEPWSLGFHETAWGEELERLSLEQLDDLGAILFGRATYQGMAAYWTKATGSIAERMNALDKVVFSSTLPSADWRNTRLVHGDPAAAVAALKREPGKDLYVFGSAKLCDALSRAGLFDEYRICVAPVVLGAGAPLWKPGPERRLRLLEARALATGAVVLRYAPVAAG
jgi:dihydrofolate reductase